MKKLCMSAALAAIAMLLFGNSSTKANNNDDRDVLRLSARLSSFNEVLPKGTGGHGTFLAQLSSDGSTLNWTLTWTGLTGPPAAAHIHFAQSGVNGQVMTFFCGGPKGVVGIPQKPDCPQTTSGSITGTTTAADIVALNTAGAGDQGLDQHDFATFLRAIRNGDGYANMHTARFPGGEIRGQLAVHRGDDDDDRD